MSGSCGVAHVVGVAGVGMSALAQALVDAGWEVTGSDRFADAGQDLDVLRRLRAAGIRVVAQDGSGVEARTQVVAVSTAIEADNPDLVAAARHGVEVVHRAVLLARLAAGKRLLAVTGTAGKTTVTGMIGHCCAEAGMDPVVINGGAVVNWVAEDRVGNVRRGRGDWWILEADESDKSLVAFAPTCSVITNVSKDHYALDEVVRVFRAFRDATAEWTVLGAQAARVLDGAMEETEAGGVERDGEGYWFSVDGVVCRVPMPGRHNAENAWLAARVCRRMGIAPEVIAAALGSFRGIQRRLERVAERDGVVVYDDYAHNPAKIAASWRAVAETAGRVLGVWRPHGFGPLALLFDELVAAWAEVCRSEDRLYILPVFYAGGTATPTRDAERLVEALQARGVGAEWVADYAALRAVLGAEMRRGDAVLGMGARDPELPAFLRGL